MKNIKTMIAIVGVAGCISTAHSQIERTRSGPQNFFTNNSDFYVDGIDGSTDTRLLVLNDAMYGEDLRIFNDSFSVGGGEFPSISSLDVNTSLTTQASSTRFETSWSYSSVLNLNNPLTSDDELGVNGGSLSVGSHFLITENCRVRISFSYTAGGLVGSPFDEGDNSTVIEASSSTGAFQQFIAGFGTNDITVGNFSFELDMVAGSEFDIYMSNAFNQYNDGTFRTDGWNQFQQGSFIVEVVPAPSGAFAMGIAGLLVNRRRRK